MYGLSHSVEDHPPAGDYPNDFLLNPGIQLDRTVNHVLGMVTVEQFDCAVMTEMRVEAYQRDINDGVLGSDPMFYHSFHEPLGNWLVRLHQKMRITLQVAENGNITGLRKPDTNKTIGIGGAYFHALHHLLELAADTTSDVTTVEVMWEIYSWLNENKAKNPDALPYVLDTQYWPQMTPEVTLAIMDGSAPVTAETSRFPEDERMYDMSSAVQTDTSVTAAEDGVCAANFMDSNDIIGWHSELQRGNGIVEDDADSDTDIDARVSPEDAPHPLASGDLIEDEEMLARSGSSSTSIPSLLSPNRMLFANARTAFSAAICDNA